MTNDPTTSAFSQESVEEPSSPLSESRRVRMRRIEVGILAGIVTLFIVQTLLIVSKGSPLGHDEAVYALRARDFLTGDVSGWYWFPFRAPGLPLALTPVAAFRATEPYLRMVIAGFGAILVVSTWWLGRTMFGRRAGLIAAAGVALTPAIVATSVQVWPDVPGAAIGFLAIALYAWALAGSRLTVPVMVGIGILTGIATLIRFGAPIPIGIGLAAVTVWRYQLALETWRRVLGVAFAASILPAVILLVPGATAWAQWTANAEPVAAFESFSYLKASKGFHWTTGFIDYWRARGRLVGTSTVAFLVGVGLLGAMLGAVQRKVSALALAVVITSGVLTFGVLAYMLTGEIRYLSPAIPWVWIGAASGIAYLTKHWSRLTTVALGTVILIVGVTSSMPQVLKKYDFNRNLYSVIQTASVAIDDASTDYTCSVITSYTPQVGWYSKCVVFPFDRLSVGLDAVGRPDGDRYLMLVSQGKRQPKGALLEQYLDETSGVFLELGDPDDGPAQYVEVHTIDSEN
jgi:4-amino-4-deoxy-L-arabinose transferase-like glycosyltransferase